MRRIIVVSVCLLAALALGASTTPVNATTPTGPVCFSTAPFADILVWFLDFHGTTPNWFYFDAIGQDLAGNRPQSVSAFVDQAGTTLYVGYTTYPRGSGVPVIASGTLNVATLSGPGRCFAPDFASCGNFTFQVITCPGGAAPIGGGFVQGME